MNAQTRPPRGQSCLLVYFQAIQVGLLTLCGQPHCPAAGIEVRGDTRTQVGFDAAGKALILPAPPQRDVSYNAFNRFDVTPAGAEFRNADSRARTIVAEVFSAAPSRIEGPISLDGPRANLILANQNGIQINGGNFVNFGSVALTTGKVTLRDETLAPGLVQRYVDVNTEGGTIDIEAGGLTGNLIHLELIARRIGIDGPISNVFTSPTAVVRAVAGASLARFDTAASPSDNLTPWVYYNSLGNTADTGADPDAIAINLSERSAITAGRIELIVSDLGAGVRNAGELLAASGDFVINADGLVQQNGGHIRAAGNIRVQAGNYRQDSREDVQSQLLAGQSLRIDSPGNIVNQGGQIQGGERDPDDADTPFSVMLNAGGDIDNHSLPGGHMAILHGGNDDVGVFSGGAIDNHDARIVANGKLFIDSVGEARIETGHTAGSGRSEQRDEEPLLFGLLERKTHDYQVDLGQLDDPEHQSYWVGESGVSIHAANLHNIGGHIYSNQGDVIVDAGQAVETQALAIGDFSYHSRCVLIFCKQEANSTQQSIGGLINAGGKVEIRAGERILNDGGNVLGITDVILDAPQIIARGQPYHSVIVRNEGLKALFGDSWAQIYANDQGGGFTAQQGRLILRGTAMQDRGYFAAGLGIEGDIQQIAPPQRQPVVIEDPLGLLFW